MTPKVPDYGHRKADKELTALIRRLHLSYRSARIGLQEKLEKYFKQFEKEDAKMRALYDSGELSHEDYLSWRYRKIAGTKQWKDMLSQLANDIVHQNQIAASMINDTLPGVYAENHNYGTYEAESGSGVDTTYTLYDKDTVSRLLKGTPDLLPAPSVKIAKDKQWNQQQIQSALLQGLLQGESMRGIANRFNELTPSKTVDDIRDAYKMTADQIAKAIARKNAIAAMRNARTAVTGAENAGRIDSYLRAQSMGIKMKQVWMAALDSRTRDSHALLDGEKQDPGKRFSNGCRYPGDPEGKPAEIYNCRCTLVAEVEGSDAYDASDLSARANRLDGMSYEQWKEWHRNNIRNGIMGAERESERSRLVPGSDERAIVSDIIGTDAYKDKFRILKESKKITNIMAYQARKTLWRRNGTPYEDLIFVDPKTEKHLSQRGQDIEGGVFPTEKMKKMALKNPGGIIAMHNHPHNMLPSFSDLKNAKRYKYGLILCHNGTIVKYAVSGKADLYTADEILNAMQKDLDNQESVAYYIKLLSKLGVQMEIL